MNCNDCGGFLPRGCTCDAFGGRAERSMFTPDPMELPLPCDITVGGGTFRKGVKLSTFVEAARRWHREAYPELYTLTDEQKAANLALLQGANAQDRDDGLTGPLPEEYDDNPEGLRPGQDAPVRMNEGTGAWEPPELADGTIGAKIDGWYCYGMPTEPLSPEQRAEVIEYARAFEECAYSREELTELDDSGIVAAAYSAMADYARGQM